MQKGLFSEMVLLDANKAKAEGEAMDISHGLPFTHAMDIYAGEYEDIADASVVIITAGANLKPGETRLSEQTAILVLPPAPKSVAPYSIHSTSFRVDIRCFA